MKTFEIVLTFCLFFCFNFINAQDNCKVLVTNSGNGNITVKWYSENIYFDEPVYVFRQQSGSNDWTLISTKPLIKGTAIDEDIVENDKILNVLQNKVLVSNSAELDGITKLVLMIKSVQYPEVSEFLGIQLIDTEVSKSVKYRYMISRYVSPKDTQLGMSEWIVADDYFAAEPPSGIITSQEGCSLHFSWIPDENLVMGVYILRAENGNEFKKITTVPVIPGTDEKGNYLKHFYTDDSLKVGTEYSYKIISIDYFGRENKPSAEIKVKIKDMEPPIAPDKVVCEIQGKNVNLYWENENVPDLAGYKVYRAVYGSEDYVCLNQTIIPKETQIFADNVVEIGVYNYRVATVDIDGNEALSEVYPVEIKDVFAPTAPLMVTAIAESGKITLNWQPSPEKDVLGYYIFRSIRKESAFLPLNSDPVSVTTYVDILPANAKNNFVYKVVAVDSSYNRSSMSDAAQTRMPDVISPEKPIIKSLKQSKNSIIVEWFPNNDSDLAGYNVYRFNENDGVESAKKINNNTISKITLFTDMFPDLTQTNCYYITAIDSSGNTSEMSEMRTCKIQNNIKSEDLFKSFTVKYNKKSKLVELKWQVMDTEDELSFIVYKKFDETENFKPISGKIIKPEFKDKPDKTDVTIFYRIAIISGNDIEYSKTESIIIKL